MRLRLWSQNRNENKKEKEHLGVLAFVEQQTLIQDHRSRVFTRGDNPVTQTIPKAFCLYSLTQFYLLKNPSGVIHNQLKYVITIKIDTPHTISCIINPNLNASDTRY